MKQSPFYQHRQGSRSQFGTSCETYSALEGGNSRFTSPTYHTHGLQWFEHQDLYGILPKFDEEQHVSLRLSPRVLPPLSRFPQATRQQIAFIVFDYSLPMCWCPPGSLCYSFSTPWSRLSGDRLFAFPRHLTNTTHHDLVSTSGTSGTSGKRRGDTGGLGLWRTDVCAVTNPTSAVGSNYG
jgi:hypothetical protein